MFIELAIHTKGRCDGNEDVEITRWRCGVTKLDRIRNERIGLYRENAIAIENGSRYPNGGNVYYVTSLVMQITFHIPEFEHKEHNLHCDIQSSLAITRPVITLIGCNAVGRASRFFGR